MKRLAMILVVTFTMGLAASTVSASTVSGDDTTKAKKECCSKDKKDTAAEKKADKKADKKS